MRIVHLSDVHVWRYAFNPMRLLSKRAVGMAGLVAVRARKFRLERLNEVVERIRGLEADHLLITGDLTTTALRTEFRDARAALAPLLVDSDRVTVLPGNHDRYTGGSVRARKFEEWFGAFAPPEPYPWMRWLDADTAILGLDPTRAHLTATGRLPAEQLERARALLGQARPRLRRLIVACHYPLAAPGHYAADLRKKRMVNADEVAGWLSGVGTHLYCCGHVHAAWVFAPHEIPGQLCVNAGAPLLRDPSGLRPPGFLEITLHDRDVSVEHHAWMGGEWVVRPLHQDPCFFPPRDAEPGVAEVGAASKANRPG
ncbi:MAG: metallophosphoesterase [Isosphaeraceae bacterium]